MPRPQVGWYVHYNDMWGEPCDMWAVVTKLSEQFFWVRLLDRDCPEQRGEDANTRYNCKSDHCTVYPEPPDEFYVWQAKRALLGDEQCL